MGDGLGMARGVDRLGRDSGPDGGNSQVRHDRCGPNGIRFGTPRAVSSDRRSLGPNHGAAPAHADPGQKQDPGQRQEYRANARCRFSRCWCRGSAVSIRASKRASRARTLPRPSSPRSRREAGVRDYPHRNRKGLNRIGEPSGRRDPYAPTAVFRRSSGTAGWPALVWRSRSTTCGSPCRLRYDHVGRPVPTRYRT
jgi:hypothetical protein